MKAYRKTHGLTQTQLAGLLRTSQPRLSKIESGSLRVRAIEELQAFADQLDLPYERLGLLPNNAEDSRPNDERGSKAPAVDASHEQWRRIRRELNAHRLELGELASQLYPDAQTIEDTPIMTQEKWLPGTPIELSEIELSWLPETPKPTITGDTPLLDPGRPLTYNGDSTYTRYSRALRDLARPKLLDNRWSYRAIDLNIQPEEPHCQFGYTTYFEVLDVGEALAHELTGAWLNSDRSDLSLVKLPFRRSISDPFDLRRRPMLPSINTLTIRRDPFDGHKMYLHRRDASSVAIAGGMYHVSPAGVFQPASLAPEAQARDFSLWRNIQREYSEEFLGNPEHDGNSAFRVEYETEEPFISFEAARRSGLFRIFVCAIVIEPLTLWVEFLTVAVIEAEAFDRLFSEMVAVNDEGYAVSSVAGRPSAGIPFSSEALNELHSQNAVSPITAACLRLAWRNRRILLGS